MRIGILGTGQLGQMLALAGYPLGLEFYWYDITQHRCYESLNRSEYDGYDCSLDEFMQKVDTITFETENIPVSIIKQLQTSRKVFPNDLALTLTQNRIHEKNTFNELAIPTADFYPIIQESDLKQAELKLGFPMLLKTATLGYDGKGQVLVHKSSGLKEAWLKLNKAHLIAESFVQFDRELSIIGVRSIKGEMKFYPISENTHHHGILRRTVAPAKNYHSITAQAQHYLTTLFEHMDYCGVMALELFDTKKGLMANEMAPRVHNSGHWTQNGAITSQFENHLRAICDYPLGSTDLVTGVAGMINILSEVKSKKQILSDQNAHLHLYRKEARPLRKLGHINFCARSYEELESCFAEYPEYAEIEPVI